MKTIELNPDEVVINAAIAARIGDPNPERVQELAANMMERREQGKVHQIQPGVVRPTGDGKYEVIAGRHRFESIKYLNTMLPKGATEDDKFKFFATVVRENDDADALLTSLDENERRTESSIFDRADSIYRLTLAGKTQAFIANRMQLSEGQVSSILKVRETPKKYRKMVEDGDMTEDALITLMGVKNGTLRNEIAQMAITNRRKEDEILNRIKAASEAAEKGEEEGEKAQEEAPKTNGKGKGKGKKEAAAPAPAKKSKVSKEDIKVAAKEKGALSGPVPLSKSKFVVMLESLSEDKEKPVPASAKKLMGIIEGVLDGDNTSVQLRNAFNKFCVAD